jgi:antitoxin FitA
MATLTIRNLPDDVHQGLRQRAAANGRSMEAEARVVLSQVVAPVDSDVDESLREQRAAKWAKIQSKAQEILKRANGGVMPTGVVDEWLAQKRIIAAEEHARMDRLAGIGGNHEGS